MSYQTLEQRFLARSTEIYNKFSNTSATNPEIKPDSRASRSRIKDDNRSLPTVSTQRDTSRIFNFLKSRDGVLFLSKQLLLQTGNTFAETRLFNPLEIQINSAPFVHAVRHLGKPIGNFTTPTRDARGALQQETVNSFAVKTGGVFTQYIQSRANQLLNAALAPIQALLTAPKKTSDGFYIRPEDDTNWSPRIINPQPLTNRGSKWLVKNYNTTPQVALGQFGTFSIGYTLPIYVNNLAKINVFPILRPLDINSGEPIESYMLSLTKNTNVGYNFRNIGKSKLVKFKKPRNVLDTYKMPSNDDLEIASAFNNGHQVNTPQGSITIYGALSNYSAQTTNQTSTGQFFYNLEAKSNGKTLVQDQTGNGYFDGPLFSRKLGNTNGEDISTIAGPAVSKIKDKYNELTDISKDSLTSRADDLRNNLVLYDTILGPKDDKSDIIKFIFKSTDRDAQPVHFRAFISSIKETTKPEYSEQRYIGRTERFVTYAGVKRTVNLEFNIVALSANEIDNMWLRINYLTGLAFPKGASPSGFMIPPLFKITIGGIYEDQPCYVDSLDYDLLDDKITFDIDSEVSQVINVRLSLTLLEKRSKFYNSPFYKVVEELQKSQLGGLPAIPATSATSDTAQATATTTSGTITTGTTTATTPARPIAGESELADVPMVRQLPDSSGPPATPAPAARPATPAPAARPATPARTAPARPAPRPAVRQPAVTRAERQQAEAARQAQRAQRFAPPKSNPELEAYLQRIRAQRDSAAVAITKLGIFPIPPIP